MRHLMFAALLSAPIACTSPEPPINKAPDGSYDLVAAEVVHLPKEVVAGDGVVFVTEVANRGRDAIPPRTYRVELYVDDERVSFDYATSGLGPGLSVTYAMSEGYHHFMPVEPGTYTYRWVLDKEDNLPETDETNNVIEGTIVVAERSARHDSLQAVDEALLDQLALIGRSIVEGRLPPGLDPGPDSLHQEVQWFADLFDDTEIAVYPGDHHRNYLTSYGGFPPPGERATHRLAFKTTGAREWRELFVHYFDGEEWAERATNEWDRDNLVTMTFRVDHDEQSGVFRLLDFTWSSLQPDESGWLGVELKDADGGGAVVGRVEDGGPGQEAGLEEGDILLTLADKPTTPMQLNFLLPRMKPGSEVPFGLSRGGVLMEKTVRLGTRPSPRRPGLG